MYNGNYKVASLVYIYNVYVCSKTIFSPVIKIGMHIQICPQNNLKYIFAFRIHNHIPISHLLHAPLSYLSIWCIKQVFSQIKYLSYNASMNSHKYIFPSVISVMFISGYNETTHPFYGLCFQFNIFYEHILLTLYTSQRFPKDTKNSIF